MRTPPTARSESPREQIYASRRASLEEKGHDVRFVIDPPVHPILRIPGRACRQRSAQRKGIFCANFESRKEAYTVRAGPERAFGTVKCSDTPKRRISDIPIARSR